jgi:signal transduction histidine kinase
VRRSIYLKFLTGYLIFGIASVLFITFFFEEKLYDIILKSNAKDLYSQANVLSEKYGRSKNFDIFDNDYDFNGDINKLMIPEDSTAWIMAASGQVLYSSEHASENLYLGDLTNYWADNYYAVGNYNQVTKTTYLSAYSPIVHNYRTYGYIVINMDINSIKNETTTISNYVYYTFLILFLFSLSLIIIFHIFVYRPIKSIKKAAEEYALGNFSYPYLNIKSKDELGDLSQKLNYMAKEVSNTESYHKKFIANISHDFRSPLTSIKGYVEAMLDGTIPFELQEKYLKILLFETERLNKLTGSLLTLNTWDSGGNKPELNEFDIVNVMRDTISSFEGQCKNKLITVNLMLNESSYPVLADQIKIQQVIYNLIDNAIKFSNNNSKIIISVYDKNDKVFISIKDNGCGISKNNLNKIWDRFYKTDSSRGKDKTGTGLGLSIVKDIIKAHNENIDVISTVGIGTEFVFTLTRSKRNYFQS